MADNMVAPVSQLKAKSQIIVKSFVNALAGAFPIAFQHVNPNIYFAKDEHKKRVFGDTGQ